MGAFDKLPPRSPVTAFSITAYNAMLDMLAWWKTERGGGGRHGGGGFPPRGDVVWIKNSSGADRDRFDILGISDVLYDEAEAPDEFKNKRPLVGVLPDPDKHVGNFAVLLGPAAKDGLGRVCVSGLCVAQVEIVCLDHQYADISLDPDATDEELVHLVSTQSGMAQIKWQPGLTGLQWCALLLSTAPPRRHVYALDDCTKETETRYVTNDLAEEFYDEKIIKVAAVDPDADPICYEIRDPCPTEIPECPPPGCVEILGTFYDCDECKACWLLESCEFPADPDHAILTDDDMSAHEGKTVRLDDGKCYVVWQHPSGETAWYGDNCNDVTSVVVDKGFDDCAGCGCFKLIDCAEVADPVYAREAVDEDGENVSLADFIEGGDRAGEVLRLDDMICYTVEEHVGEECDTVSVAIVVLEAYPDCAKCVCFLLEDCEAIEPDIVTYTDLNEFLNKVVRIGEICYNVGPNEDCTDAVRVEIDSDYADCAGCIIKYRLTNSCTVECDDPDAEPMPDIVTRENMEDAVGKFVKIGGYCYAVSVATEGDVTQRELDYGEVYTTCKLCLAAGSTAKKTYLTNLKIVARDGEILPKLVAEREQQVWQDGKLLGFCKLKDLEIEIDDACPA